MHKGLGRNSDDYGLGIAVDSSGNVYVMGTTSSTDFPTTADAFQKTHAGGGQDAFVTELNATGSALIYSTYLGGGGDDRGQGIALDSSPIPNVYGSGITSSTDFPTTAGAFQATIGGGTFDAFVVKIGAGDNTPAGTNVTVQPVDTTTGTSPATLPFSNVTQAGTTTLTTSGNGALPPVGFKAGDLFSFGAVLYEMATVRIADRYGAHLISWHYSVCRKATKSDFC